ncbi:ATP-binding cassette domain-containing protein [Vibrio sp. DW001]|uniref:ATP-binding cassette domain-containing protein n=1 Tax=Vibrio sp. DW001 TaxID=2912315 RepID=UPI0023B14BBE|nr:ATP-binding cassette domain-containing protein [Vibrio sp. DW001]WED29083.1 ATP-binding cassette domain-containing protein [Vibrio sp. DW001]
MPASKSAITTHQLSFQLDTGEWLFNDLNLNINEKIAGLVGRNGVGKSVLIALLSGQRIPTKGSVITKGKVGYYSQRPFDLIDSQLTIAEFMGVSKQLSALKSIQQGSSEQRDFDIIAEDWTIEDRMASDLLSLRIPADPSVHCRCLSGGQLALLQLHRLFQSGYEVLLLDEPTNHLDSIGREWLIKCMQQFDGVILLVSHDRALLNQVEAIYQLTRLGVDYFSGNYDDYLQHSRIAEQALNKRIEALKSEQKKLMKQTQTNREKRDQRESKGKQLRKSGSQAKILLDAIKNKAEQCQSAGLRNQRNQMVRNQNKLADLETQQETVKPQALYVQQAQELKKRTLLRVTNCTLDYGSDKEMTFTVSQTERLHLDGPNGSGKSTLLKAIHGKQGHYNGEIKRYAKTVYMDQNFGLLEPTDSVIESLLKHSDGLVEGTARILLAGIGFRRDSVYRNVAHLSGGEKMKLSMLLVSHIADGPLLLLDEPDNHLDIESKQRLAIALNQYKGAFILVSHDAFFIEAVGINKVLTFYNL